MTRHLAIISNPSLEPGLITLKVFSSEFRLSAAGRSDGLFKRKETSLTDATSMLGVERADDDLISETTAATAEERRCGRRQRAILLEWLMLSRYEHMLHGHPIHTNSYLYPFVTC